MKAIATIKKLNSNQCKLTIVRNLSRIMDIKILDIDIENNTVSFAFESRAAFEKVKKELLRIGYPLEKLLTKEPLPRLTF